MFIFWGIDFGASAASFAAKVDGEEIPIETVRRAWQQRQSQLQQMLRDELPADMVKSQQAAVLDQFVSADAPDATRGGIRLSRERRAARETRHGDSRSFRWTASSRRIATTR